MAPYDPSGPKDRTFLKYTKSQAQAYNTTRPAGNDAFFKAILDHHGSTGGKLGRVVDIGCGPGTSTRYLAQTFTESIGVDGSPEMLRVARETEDDATLGAAAQSRQRIRYIDARAEDFDRQGGIGEGSVDLITVGQAAHWFDMPDFYAACKRALRPGGTIAIWTYASFFAHPETPNYEQVQAALFRLEDEWLAPFTAPGNVLVRGGYDDLGLPWTGEPKVDGFPESEFTKLEWNRDGKVEKGGEFFCFDKRVAPEQWAIGIGTASMTTRWREAHPELAHTDKDPVVATFNEVKRLLGDEKTIRGGCSTHLLLFKRR